MNLLRSFIGKKIIDKIGSMIFNREGTAPQYMPVLLKLPAHSQAFGEVTRETAIHISGFEQRAAGIAKRGIVDGTNGVPDVDSTKSYAENEISHEYEASQQEISIILSLARDQLKKMVDSLTSTLQGGSIEKAYQDKHAIRKREALNAVNQEAPKSGFNQKLKALLQKTGSITGVITLLKEQLRQWEEKKLYADGRFQQLKVHVYHNMPPRKRWIDYGFVFTGLIILLFSVEYFANFTAFREINLGGNNIGSLLIGLFATAAQAYYAKELGKALSDKNKRRILVFTAVTLAICFIVCIPRLLMPDNLLLKALYIVLNFAIAGTTVRLAYSHAKHHEFFDQQKERDRLAKDIIRLSQKIGQIEADYENRIEEVEERCRIEMDQSIQAAKAELQRQIDQIHTELSKLDSLQDKCIKHLDKIRLSALERYRHLNSDARKQNGHTPVKHWQQSHGNDDSSLLKKVSVILLCLSFGLMSCSEPPETHLEILYDQTDGSHQPIQTEPMLDYILDKVDDDFESGNWGKTTVTLSQIGETSTQFSRTVTLPMRELFLWRNENEHKQRPDQFKQELQAALDSLTQPAPELDHSYIHRNFYYRLKELSKKQGRKIVLSWSDLILNDPPVNFYLYEEKPDKILEQKESLIKMMTKDYPLDSLELKGIELVNFHHPPKRYDALYEVLKKFFGDYWESQGMKVEFKSALPAKTAILSQTAQ